MALPTIEEITEAYRATQFFPIVGHWVSGTDSCCPLTAVVLHKWGLARTLEEVTKQSEENSKLEDCAVMARWLQEIGYHTTSNEVFDFVYAVDYEGPSGVNSPAARRGAKVRAKLHTLWTLVEKARGL